MVRGLVLASLLLAMGCADDRPPGGDVEPTIGNGLVQTIRAASPIDDMVLVPEDATPIALEIGFANPWLAGDLGELRDFDGVPHVVAPRGDAGWGAVELWYTDLATDDVAMTAFVVDGGFDDPLFREEGHYEFFDSGFVGDGRDFGVRILGCSWPSYGPSFDDWATKVVVNVIPGETEDAPTQVDFEADFDAGYGGQTVVGGFHFVPP